MTDIAQQIFFSLKHRNRQGSLQLNMDRYPRGLINLLPLIIGIFFLFIGVGFFFFDLSHIRRSKIYKAEIIEIREIKGRRTSYAPVVRFQDVRGQIHEDRTSQTYFNHDKLRIGDMLNIYYDLSNPDRIMINEGDEWYVGYVIFALMGIASLSYGILILRLRGIRS